MSCKGNCTRYRPRAARKNERYRNGQKRCQICDVFMQYEGVWCPCCGVKLRSKPRNRKYREALHQ